VLLGRLLHSWACEPNPRVLRHGRHFFSREPAPFTIRRVPIRRLVPRKGGSCPRLSCFVSAHISRGASPFISSEADPVAPVPSAVRDHFQKSVDVARASLQRLRAALTAARELQVPCIAAQRYRLTAAASHRDEHALSMLQHALACSIVIVPASAVKRGLLPEMANVVVRSLCARKESIAHPWAGNGVHSFVDEQYASCYSVLSFLGGLG